MPTEQHYMRKNGFERPFHPLQLLSWVVFGLDVLIFCMFSLPLVETDIAKIIVSSCYAFSVLALVGATVKATACDPTDPALKCKQDSDLSAAMPFCSVCNVPVHPRSKHCRACNKCVKVFDHHCMWLNNCIGEANYHWFTVSISSCALMIGIILGVIVYLFVDYFLYEDRFAERLSENALFENVPKEVFLGLFVVMAFVNVPLFVLDMQLVMLHLFLTWQNITTYEYINNKRAEPDWDEYEQTGDERGGRIRRRLRTLPRCMDWIIFCQPCKRRRKKEPQQENTALPQLPTGASSLGSGFSAEAEAVQGSYDLREADPPPVPHSNVRSREDAVADIPRGAPPLGCDKGFAGIPADEAASGEVAQGVAWDTEAPDRRRAEASSSATPPVEPPDASKAEADVGSTSGTVASVTPGQGDEIRLTRDVMVVKEDFIDSGLEGGRSPASANPSRI